jgi:hypothetical protein
MEATLYPYFMLWLGIEFSLKLIETEALKGVGAKLTSDHPIPACQSEPFKSRAYWKCFARQTTSTRKFNDKISLYLW